MCTNYFKVSKIMWKTKSIETNEKIEDEELEALLDEDQCQTQAELALSLVVTV